METTVSQPHVWEQVLFYLAALETYPPTDEYGLDLTERCGGVIDQLRDIGTNGPDHGRDETPPTIGAGTDGDAEGRGGGGGDSDDPSLSWPVPDSR